MGKVYVVIDHWWQQGIGGDSDSYYDEIDSIWSTKEAAKIRIDDLANEYVRQAWYDSGCDMYDFTVKQEWNEERTEVRSSTDPYEEITAYIKEVKLNTVNEFIGP